MNTILKVFEDTLFHGSRKNRLKELSVKYAYDDSYFGPALYLSKDYEVACANSGSSTESTVYEVAVSGPIEGILNLDASIDKQSRFCKVALELLRKNFREQNTLIPKQLVKNYYDFLTEKHSKKIVNHALTKLRVWMLTGTMDSMAYSGIMDRGIHYVILDERRTKIVRALSHSDYYRKK